MAPGETPMKLDRYDNPIDDTVGYARGMVLKSSADEARKLLHAQKIATKRVLAKGIDSITVFTGNVRDYPIREDDISTLCEEWIGAGLLQDDLHSAAIQHLGGDASHTVFIANRTSAGLIAAVCALSNGLPVLSVVPQNGRPHASVYRGCDLARVGLVNIESNADMSPLESLPSGGLAVVTTVTSRLEIMTDAEIGLAIEHARRRAATVLLDEAYGARVRTLLKGGRPSLALGADLVITNGDKAGLAGPRCGILAGKQALLDRVRTQASEWGMEARAPIQAGALRALQSFDGNRLIKQAGDGAALCAAMQDYWGEALHRTVLGPMINEDDIFEKVAHIAQYGEYRPTPCEVTSALGIVLLRDHGLITANTHGQPGASPTLRLKPVKDAVARLGGADAVAGIIRNALETVAANTQTPQQLASLLYGET